MMLMFGFTNARGEHNVHINPYGYWKIECEEETPFGVQTCLITDSTGCCWVDGGAKWVRSILSNYSPEGVWRNDTPAEDSIVEAVSPPTEE